MILHKKSDEKEIKEVLKRLPRSKYVFLFEGNDKFRYAAYRKKHPFRPGTLKPGSGIDLEFSEKWMDSMEYNLEIVKRILSKEYVKDEKTFGDLKLTYPKILRKK